MGSKAAAWEPFRATVAAAQFASYRFVPTASRGWTVDLLVHTRRRRWAIVMLHGSRAAVRCKSGKEGGDHKRNDGTQRD